MRILQVHKYYSKKRGSGSVTAFFELVDILRKNGQEVSIFSMKDKNNRPSEYEKYFTTHFDLNEKMSFWRKARLVERVIFNFEAKRKIEELVEKEKPDIAHLHNFYHYLSPSIIWALKKKNIPIVMTLHDYKLICPNYKLFVKGRTCKRCKGGKYYQCFLNKCFKDSWSSSFVIMLEAYLHKFLKTYQKIDLFIAPSRFMKDKCVEFGIPENKIEVLKNPFNTDGFSPAADWKEEYYFIYYGRLAKEKGIQDLILSTKKLADENKLGKNKLLIIGKGPEEEALKKKTAELDLKEKVSFLGFIVGNELERMIAASKFVVLPSVWYDNLPLVVLESQLLEKPLIISNLGGSKELMQDQETGLIFRGGDIEDLESKLEIMLEFSSEKRRAMGKRGRENVLRLNDERELYEKLMEIYKETIKKDLIKK